MSTRFSLYHTLSEDSKAISAVLLAYQDALNESSVPAVMALYAPDGVFMPQHFPSTVGTSEIKTAYEAIFGQIQLVVKFTIVEIVETGTEWAFAQTKSAGHTVLKATGASGGKEANQELFVMKKIGPDWKIARYCFCTTNPPPALS
ncbi:MAG: hypothetical protein M1838_005433 [Thelocarpon superellum]|nr:MAG: hypothetical protein M1838_005433 [Thelocarpon superellum]